MGKHFTQAEHCEAEFSSAGQRRQHPVPELGQLWSFFGAVGRAVVAWLHAVGTSAGSLSNFASSQLSEKQLLLACGVREGGTCGGNHHPWDFPLPPQTPCTSSQSL